ncbi:MAG: asparagine synthase (glutamine-hydrolyzing) [Candidatus Adlerbacteria bacterium]
MCGIISIVGKGAAQTPLDAALGALSKRGPDDHGSMAFDGAVLGQTRLAIIDLSPSGHQPMRDNAKNVAITFNGEIYNYKELRKELESKGHRFSTQSDTEVILKAYEEYGNECPKYLDGMFAFVIWDDEKKQAFMARDRFGKKPLFYAHTPDGKFVAGSEIKALKAVGVQPEIDPAGIDAYLTLMYIPPWRTVYKNVHTILGGHSATYTAGQAGKDSTLDIQQYWKLTRTPISISYDDAKEKVRQLFTESIRKRMIADVEIGSFLSGGVDSTIVTTYAQKLTSSPIKTFSLGYGADINELPFAEEASKKIGTDHYTLQATSELTDELEKILTYFDEPHGDSANFPQHLVSELASNHVKVALSGDGGDELFMGYGWYFQHWHRPKIMKLKAALFSNPYKEYLKSITVFPASMRRGLLKDAKNIKQEDIDQLVSPVSDATQNINAYDLSTYLPGQLLTKVDQASMMHGLEVRCPLLDHQLTEFVVNLPQEYKINRGTGKLLLKDLLRETMPDAFVDRKKQGFGAPVRKWLSQEKMRAYVHKEFAPGAPIFEHINEESARSFVENTFSGQNPKKYYQLWVLLCLAIWLKKHV